MSIRRSVVAQIGLATALLASAVVASAADGTSRPTCAAHAQLEHGGVALTFDCTATVSRVRVVAPSSGRILVWPYLRVAGSKAARRCAVARHRVVVCDRLVRARKAAVVDVTWQPSPAVGEAVSFTAFGPAGSVRLRLTVTSSSDGD